MPNKQTLEKFLEGIDGGRVEVSFNLETGEFEEMPEPSKKDWKDYLKSIFKRPDRQKWDSSDREFDNEVKRIGEIRKKDDARSKM